MLNQHGYPEAVPVEQIQDAYSRGYQVEDPAAVAEREKREKYDTAANEALTFAEGAASDLTFGASDHLLAEALGDEYRQEASARREINPHWHTAGRITGAVAPALMTGGSSAVARAALAPGRAVVRAGQALETAAGASRLGRIGGAAAANALEGASYAFSRANSELALGDTDMTAEKLLAATGSGALWGGIGGGVVKAGGMAIGAAGKAAVSRMTGGVPLKDAVRSHLGKRALKDVAGEAPIPVSSEHAKTLGEKLLRLGVDVDDLARARPAMAAAAKQADDIAARMSQVVDDAGVRPDLAKVFRAADDQAAKLRETPTPEFQVAAKQVERQLKPLRDAVKKGREFSVRELWEVRKSLARAKPKDELAGEAMRSVRQSLDEALDESFDRVAPDALQRPELQPLLKAQRNAKDAWRQAAKDSEDWHLLNDLAAKRPEPAQEHAFSLAGHNTALGVLTGVATGSVGLGLMPLLFGRNQIKDYVMHRGARGLMRMADRLTRVETRLDDAARSIVAGADKGAGAAVDPNVTGGARGKLVGNLAAELARAESGELQAELAQDYADQPEVALALTQRLTDDAAYIKSIMPQAFSSSDVLQLDDPKNAKISPLEVKRLEKIVAALNDPAGVMADIARGRYSPDAMAALRERRPLIYADMRQRVIQELAARDKPLPYSRRVLIGTAFEIPTDWSLNPANLAAAQASAAPPPAEPGASPQPSQGANINPALAERYALPSNPIGTPR